MLGVDALVIVYNNNYIVVVVVVVVVVFVVVVVVVDQQVGCHFLWLNAVLLPTTFDMTKSLFR